MPISSTPPRWQNQRLTLYHGTVSIYQASILSGVVVTKGRPSADFGRGFYTTTVLRQAQSWAWQLARRLARGHPAPLPIVIAFDVDRDALAGLAALWFVRGSFDADDYWSLVYHCRSGGRAQQRTTNQGWYDVVVGPVAASWRQRLTIHDADQISFHTAPAAAVLDRSNPRRVV